MINVQNAICFDLRLDIYRSPEVVAKLTVYVYVRYGTVYGCCSVGRKGIALFLTSTDNFVEVDHDLSKEYFQSDGRMLQTEIRLILY